MACTFRLYKQSTDCIIHNDIHNTEDAIWFKSPWGVFQERLDRVLRLVPGVLGIADDIVIHGATENTHNGTVLAQRETAIPSWVVGVDCTQMD